MLFRQTFADGLGPTTHFLPRRRGRADGWLTSLRTRRSLARTLRAVAEATARSGALGGRYRPRHTASVSRRESLETLAARLENENQPVTPAGMRRVLDLVTAGTGPLWGTSEHALDDALETTFATLAPHSNVRTPEARAA